MIQPDKINNANPAAVATASFALLDCLQSYEPHIQVMTVAAVFTALAEHHKVQPQDVFTTTKNMMSTKEGRRAEFAAVADYIKYELKGTR